MRPTLRPEVSCAVHRRAALLLSFLLFVVSLSLCQPSNTKTIQDSRVPTLAEGLKVVAEISELSEYHLLGSDLGHCHLESGSTNLLLMRREVPTWVSLLSFDPQPCFQLCLLPWFLLLLTFLPSFVCSVSCQSKQLPSHANEHVAS